MKPHKILFAAAALVLMAAIVPAATTAAVTPPVQTVQLTFVKVLCPGYTVVPANKTPTISDQTGGHGGELESGYQTALTDPTTDIPAACRRADGWQFQLYGDPSLSTLVGSP